jgi:hypothetical protein
LSSAFAALARLRTAVSLETRARAGFYGFKGTEVRENSVLGDFFVVKKLPVDVTKISGSV